MTDRPASSRPWWFDRLTRDPRVERLATLVAEGGDVSARGSAGSSTTALAATLTSHAPGPVLLVVPHLDDIDDALDELEGYGIDVAPFPALEVMPGERNPAVDLVAARLSIVRRAIEGALPRRSSRRFRP